MCQSGLGWARNSILRSDRCLFGGGKVYSIQMQSTGQIRGLGRHVNGQIRSSEQAMSPCPYARVFTGYRVQYSLMLNVAPGM